MIESVWKFAIYAVLLLSVRSAEAAAANVSLGCLVEHCALKTVECIFSFTVCDKAIGCAQKCLDGWDDDKTLEKFHVQNCTNECADSAFGDKAYYNFMACLSDYNCIGFPPIPNTCRAPKVYPQKNLTTKALNGSWWVVKGYHPVYDCYPCQHLYFAPINASFWSYKTTYDSYDSSGGVILVTQETAMPDSAAGTNITFTYHDVGGLFHYETWWLIDSADDGSYVQMYYCGHALQWYYEGALVLARNHTLSQADYAAIAKAYEKGVGLNLDDFCTTSTSQKCPD